MSNTTVDAGVPAAKPGVALLRDRSSPADRERLRTLAILCALMAFGPLSTDFYLPAMPAMAESLHTSPGTIEWTISGYLIGSSLGQLVWGPISDKYGRRLPVAIGIAIFVIGSAGCALSTSAGAMIAWRVLQAIGSCAGIALSRAMVRDLYSGARAAQMMSALITVMAVTPLIGPLIGGQILRFASWPWIFWLLAVVGVATLLALLTLPETLPPERRRRDAVSKALITYYRLLGDRRILGYAAVSASLYFGIFAYVAGTPFAYIEFYGLRPEFFGFVFASGILGIMASNLINARQVMRSGVVPILRIGASLTGRRRPVGGVGRLDRLRRLGRPCRPVVSVHRHKRADHRKFDRRRDVGVSQAGGNRFGLGGGASIRGGHGGLGPARRVFGRHAETARVRRRHLRPWRGDLRVDAGVAAAQGRGLARRGSEPL